MDNKKEASSIVKKVALPLGLFIGGLIIVGLLYFFLVSRSSLNGANSADFNAQEAFQAPAELSTAIQIECQSSVEKIAKISDCDDKATEFWSKISTCLNYDYTIDEAKIDEAKNIAPEGQYGDIVFDVVKCYASDGDLNKSVELLNKAIADLPAWEVDMGSLSCDSKSALAAYLDFYSSQSKFVCSKIESIDSILQSLKNKNISFLEQLLWTKKMPQVGLRDSDVACPQTLKALSQNLQKVLNSNVEISLNSDEKKDSANEIYIEMTKNKEQVALLKLALTDEGCLYLDSFLMSALDGTE